MNDCLGGDVEKPLFAEIVLRVIYLHSAHEPSESIPPGCAADLPHKPLPSKIVINAPSALTFTQLADRLHGQYDIDHEFSFIFRGRVFKDHDPVPGACFEQFVPTSEDRDFFRPRLVMCVDLSRPLLDAEKGDAPVERSIENTSSNDHSDAEEMEAERRRAANFRNISALFDIESEMKRIGCEQYVGQLLRAGFFQEGCFAVLTEEILSANKIFIPQGARLRLLELCERIRCGLEEKDAPKESNSRPPSRALPGSASAEGVARSTSNTPSKPAPAPIRRSAAGQSHFSANFLAKRAMIEQKVAAEHDALEGPTTVRRMALDPAQAQSLGAFCCEAHQQHVQDHLLELQNHNRHCFATELLAALRWVAEHPGGSAGLRQMVEIAMRIIRRLGWSSLEEEQLMSAMLEYATTSKEELAKAESWLINSNSPLEERALFPQSRYFKEKFVDAVVAYLQRINPEFFHNYSLV